jgi:hypothetical protein
MVFLVIAQYLIVFHIKLGKPGGTLLAGAVVLVLTRVLVDEAVMAV